MKDVLFPLARPLLHAMDAETAHTVTIRALQMGFHPRCREDDDPRLAQNLWNLHFPNPIGISAGFDKNAQVLDAVLSMGVGFMEAGSVTPRPQFGNPKPRVFREPNSHSVINRMGMSNDGMNAFWRRYKAFRDQGRNKDGIIGINIAKNKDTEDPNADYLDLIDRFAPHADYLTVNVSSPNTPGLRNLQQREFLLPMLQALLARRALVCGAERQPPLLVKLAPDLSEAECIDIAQTVMEAGIDGLVLSNTTLDRPETLPDDFRKETGGLSGPYVREKSTNIIRRFYRLTGGRLPIIGVGGIASGADAYAKIKAGACLVQLYTALVFHGPALIGRIKNDLLTCLERDGFRHVSEAIGADHR